MGLTIFFMETFLNYIFNFFNSYRIRFVYLCVSFASFCWLSFGQSTLNIMLFNASYYPFNMCRIRNHVLFITGVLEFYHWSSMSLSLSLSVSLSLPDEFLQGFINVIKSFQIITFDFAHLFLWHIYFHFYIIFSFIFIISFFLLCFGFIC